MMTKVYHTTTMARDTCWYASVFLRTCFFNVLAIYGLNQGKLSGTYFAFICYL